MSHLRDLQKLRNTKNQYYSGRNSQYLVPQIATFNFQKFGQLDSKQFINDNYNKYLQSKQILPKTRQKKMNQIHKRGISNGYSSQQKRIGQKQASKQPISSSGLSIYNFSVKLTQRKTNPLSSRKQRAIDFMSNNPSQMYTKKVKQPISKNSFQIAYPIGKGGFGKVWKVQMKKNRQIYAMKQMYKAKIIQKKSINSVMNQRNLIAKLRHPFLVNMSYAFQDRQNLYLIMDYLDGGDLRYHIGKNRNFSEKQTKFFLANIIIGLEYLHNCKIIHRDIKPQNLVLDSHGYVRITDLGVSRQLREQNHQDTSGTPGYMAPQILCKKNHTFTADYFAVGVIGYEFMLGRRPYNGKNRKQIRDQILSKQVSIRIDQLPFRWSPDAADLINKLLIRSPESRLGYNGISQIKDHKWFKDINWNQMAKKKVSAPYIPISIEDDYEQYKDQISQDTIIQNMEQNLLILRDSEVQHLFDGYAFDCSNNVNNQKKRATSYTTSHTAHTQMQNSSKIDYKK